VRRVVWTREARVNLEAIRDYIGQFNPLAANRIAVRLISTVESLVDAPHRGRPAGACRELVVVRPYIIRYRVTDDTIDVLRIRHGAMKPD
jgi:toxin ParE1/3/4